MFVWMPKAASLLRPGLDFASFLTVAILASGAAAIGQAGVTTAEAKEHLPSILVSYDFDQASDSGPDTYRLFQRPSGSVDLSRSFRISGERSLRLSEGRQDGSFSEFLGFFEPQSRGSVYVQFYVLLTDPAQRFNFALAGERWFLSYEKHGHALWLATRDGDLAHQSAGEWRTLLTPRAFSWYFVDLVYDVDAGSYDLAVYEEGADRPVVDLRDQKNTSSQPGSSIRYYSFIGDLEDEDEAMIYVDDLLIATDQAARTRPFVAPGRRSFFVDRFAVGTDKLSSKAQQDLLFEARQLAGWTAVELTTEPVSGQPSEKLSQQATTALLDFGPARVELAGDEAFRHRDWQLAEDLYRLVARFSGTGPVADRVLLKLADVYFLRGDVAAERAARERIFGRLELEETKLHVGEEAWQ
jgi:hypothetical protein